MDKHQIQGISRKQLAISEVLDAVVISGIQVPILQIVSKDRSDLYALSVVEAFNQTWGNGIDPAAVPELLSHFKLCASMLAEYLDEAHNPPINDYHQLEIFENAINKAELSTGYVFSAHTIEYQVNSAINDCHARIENGADISAALGWLQEEVDDIFNGPDRDLRRGR